MHVVLFVVLVVDSHVVVVVQVFVELLLLVVGVVDVLLLFVVGRATAIGEHYFGPSTGRTLQYESLRFFRTNPVCACFEV